MNEELWLVPYFLMLAWVTYKSKDWVQTVQIGAFLITYTLMTRYLP